MKTPLFAFSALFVLYHSSYPFVRGMEVDRALVETRSTAQLCESPDSYNVWWRAFSTSNPDHFYTAGAGEMSIAVSNDGYTFEGDAALLFSTQVEFTVPLYRLWSLSATDHFYTTNATERDNAIDNLGYVSEGTPGYIYSYQICDSVPLYRLYSPSWTDHFYTVNATERDNAVDNLSFTFEGTIGYVPQPAGRIPS